MKIDIGEIIRKRIVIFPAFEKEPKKVPVAWGLFPPFTLAEEQLAKNLEYRYPIVLRSSSVAELKAMVDRAVSAALPTIETGFWEIWLHATAISPVMRVQGTQNSEVRIIYKFRVRRIIYAPAEMPSGSVAEIPREPAPEDFEKKSTEEVKHE